MDISIRNAAIDRVVGELSAVGALTDHRRSVEGVFRTCRSELQRLADASPTVPVGLDDSTARTRGGAF